MYPDDSVQPLTRQWWIEDASGVPARGRLLWTFVPYPGMKPFRLVPEGRGDDPRQHTRANFRVEQFRIGDPPPPEGLLPVAALPLREGEAYYVQRGKVRPAVVLSAGGTEIPREIRQGEQRWHSRDDPNRAGQTLRLSYRISENRCLLNPGLASGDCRPIQGESGR